MSKLGGELANLPECWSDDTRMDVLFSPFRPRKVNPENYDGKLKFWKDMIVRFCNEKGSPCVCQRELKWAFRRKDKLPCAVETVVADLVASKTLRPQSDFINDPQNTWSGWLVNSFVRKPLQWGLPRFQAPTEPQDVQYIHLDVLQVRLYFDYQANCRKINFQILVAVEGLEKDFGEICWDRRHF